MTKKQKIFADEYLIDLNATRAYKVAYPRVKNDEVAAAAATRLLRNVKVAAYISERMQERQKRTEVTQDRVIEELAAIAFAKATDFVQISHGNVILTDTSKLSENQIKAIAGIKEGKNGIELKLNDKEKAEFYPAMFRLMDENFQRMEEDLVWLSDKFDYRNKDADWKNSKDALQRGMQKLRSGYPADPVHKAK